MRWLTSESTFTVRNEKTNGNLIFGRAARISALVCLVMVGLLIGALPAAAPASRSAIVPITVRSGVTLTMNGPFHGYGVQDDTNLVVSPLNERLGSAGISSWYQVDQPRLAQLHPAFVRKFIDLSWLSPVRGVFTPNSAEMEALYADLSFLKSSGTKVLLTFQWAPHWLNPESTQLNSNGHLGATAPDAVHVADYAGLVTLFVAQLLVGEGLTNIAAISALNEQAHGTWSDQMLAGLYSRINADLAAVGLDVPQFGPDSPGPQLAEKAKGVTVLTDQVGFIDYHDYQAERRFLKGIAGVEQVARPLGKQVWLTEMGSPTDGDVDQWQSMAVKAIDGANAGLAGISLWSAAELDEGNGVQSQFGTGLWDPPPTYNFRLTAYLTWQAITSQTYGDNAVYASSCDDGCAGRLHVAVLGDLATPKVVLVYNANPMAKTLNIMFAGPGSVFTHDMVVTVRAHSFKIFPA